MERALQRNGRCRVPKMREDSRSLERSNDAAAGDPCWPLRGDVAAVVDDRPAARFEELVRRPPLPAATSTLGVALSSGLETERSFGANNEVAATADIFGAGSRNRTGTPEGTGF